MKRGENGLTDQDVQSCRQNLEKTPMAEFEKRVDRQKMTTDNKSTINMRLFFIIISFVSEMKVKQRARGSMFVFPSPSLFGMRENEIY